MENVRNPLDHQFLFLISKYHINGLQAHLQANGSIKRQTAMDNIEPIRNKSIPTTITCSDSKASRCTHSLNYQQKTNSNGQSQTNKREVTIPATITCHGTRDALTP